MKSAEHIEQSVRRLHVETSTERRERTLRELAAVLVREEQTRVFRPLRLVRVLVQQKRKSIAAAIALAVLFIGVFSLGGGSVAFSQAVSSTLARLKEMIWELRTGEFASRPPELLPPAGDTVEQAPDPNVREVMCTARFFNIPAGEQAVWEALQDEGIELVQASLTPEAYYATLGPEQSERLESALTTKSLVAPCVIVLEGEQGMIGTDVCALAWLPLVSRDGRRIESRFSFHDGQSGFEIPNISVDDNGVILVRVCGITPAGEDILILLTIAVSQAQ